MPCKANLEVQRQISPWLRKEDLMRAGITWTKMEKETFFTHHTVADVPAIFLKKTILQQKLGRLILKMLSIFVKLSGVNWPKIPNMNCTLSTSTSPKTTAAFLPPSSRLSFFMEGAAREAMRSPTEVLPVNEITLEMGNIEERKKKIDSRHVISQHEWSDSLLGVSVPHDCLSDLAPVATHQVEDSSVIVDKNIFCQTLISHI